MHKTYIIDVLLYPRPQLAGTIWSSSEKGSSNPEKALYLPLRIEHPKLNISIIINAK